MQGVTKKSEQLARDINKALAKHNCTFGEIWFAFASNLAYLLAELPQRDREEGLVNLAEAVETMISSAKVTGQRGADIPRRGH